MQCSVFFDMTTRGRQSQTISDSSLCDLNKPAVSQKGWMCFLSNLSHSSFLKVLVCSLGFGGKQRHTWGGSDDDLYVFSRPQQETQTYNDMLRISLVSGLHTPRSSCSKLEMRATPDPAQIKIDKGKKK